MSFAVNIYSRGEFVHDPDRHYDHGELHTIHGVDIDRWSYFEALGILRNDLGINGNVRLWWKKFEHKFEEGLKEITLDSHALEMADYALNRMGRHEVDIFIEHLDVDEVVPKTQRQSVLNLDGMNDDIVVADDSSDESIRDVHLSDSEEDRAKDIDDGFDVEAPVQPPVQPQIDPTEAESTYTKRPEKLRYRRKERAGLRNPHDVFPIIEDEGDGVEGEGARAEADNVNVEGEGAGVEGEGAGAEGEGVQAQTRRVPVSLNSHMPSGMVHDIEGGYESEFIESEDSDEEPLFPAFPRFKKDDMAKGFVFKLGMEFVSLKEFKEAILEHNVLNGREIKFIKNDAKRVRVKCKQEGCPYTAFVSRVGTQHTYRLKTYVPHHTCGRVFNNSNAKSKWVAKVVIDRMKSTTSDVKLSDIISEIRNNYSTGITMSRAWKAKCMAKDVVDGDAAMQYNLLWSYAAELRRVNRGNTYRLTIQHPAESVLPRFGSFYMCLEGCKSAFTKACRPLIGVDGCHLKNKYGGQLLIAVGRDPNDQYMPIAFAVVETETKETWKWFLENLLDDIGDLASNRWVFISDQQKVMSLFLYFLCFFSEVFF